MDDEYWVPEHVREYLRALGSCCPWEAMEPYIRSWLEWMQASGSFYDYKDTDGVGRLYEVHRRSIHPAMRVCREWGALLLNDKTQVVCDAQECTDWLASYWRRRGSCRRRRRPWCGRSGWAPGRGRCGWMRTRGKVRIRHYDARMTVPLTWDEEGVSECAFVTRAFYRGRAVDQLQMHLRGREGYRIETVCFDEQGNEIAPAGVCPVYETGSGWQTFAIVRPAIDKHAGRYVPLRAVGLRGRR